MLRHLGTLFLFFCLVTPAVAQSPYAYRIVQLPALPAACFPGDVVYLTTAGSQGVHHCIAANTWRSIGKTGTAEQINITQGTITASAPFINHTATWNNIAVEFRGIETAITATASSSSSTHIRARLDGAEVFSVMRSGQINTAGSVKLGAGSNVNWDGRGVINFAADGRIRIMNNASTALTSLTLGPETVAYPRLVPSVVGAQSQGVQILRGDGTAQVFANLGAADNGSMIYCADCTKATPCAAMGAGAIAKRLNGAWDCD